MKNIFISALLLFSLNASHVFVAGEGSFYEPGSGSISRIDADGQIDIFENVGSVVHAVEAYQNMLLVSINGDHKVQIYNIFEENIDLVAEVSMDGQSPREIVVADHKAYVTTWDPDWTVYPNVDGYVKVISLDNFQVEESIQVGVMPEGLLYNNGYLWVANSGESTVSKIDVASDMIQDEVYVSQGPLFLSELNDVVYVARTYYDSSWNANFGTSKIGLDGSSQIMEYGAGIACGGSIMKYNNSIYRSFEGGVAPINQSLEIVSEEKIGNYDPSLLYHADAINENIWIALTDFSNINEVKVLNNSGDEISSYNVGAIPGDFAQWEMCYFSGDVVKDEILNVFDVVSIVDNIISKHSYNCESDLNTDGFINVLDVTTVVLLILN
jgi:hypothetical protein